MKLLKTLERLKDLCCDFVVNGERASAIWKTKIFLFETEGMNKYEVECYEAIPQTIYVNFYAKFLEKERVTRTLKEFENRTPLHKDKVIITYNCHGLSLMEKKYWIDSEYATSVIEDEFIVTTLNDAEVIGFLNTKTGVYDHTAISVKHNSKYIDKRGIRPISFYDTFKDIKINTMEYQILEEHFLKKKN